MASQDPLSSDQPIQEEQQITSETWDMASQDILSSDQPIQEEQKIRSGIWDITNHVHKLQPIQEEQQITSEPWDISYYLQKLQPSNNPANPPEGAQDHLSPLPDELLLNIMKHLNPVTSTCLSLASRRFYGLHKELHPGKVCIHDMNELGIKLLRLLHDWMGVQGFAWMVLGTIVTTCTMKGETYSMLASQSGTFISYTKIEKMLSAERAEKENGSFLWGPAEGSYFAIRLGRAFLRRRCGYDFKELEDQAVCFD